MRILFTTAATLMLAAPALGQEEGDESIALQIAQGESAGNYLADAEGRPLYTFSTDTPATDDRQAVVSCTIATCLEVWPLLTGPDDPEPVGGVDPALMGVTEHDSRQVVTYDGWPLYRFVGDAGAQEPQGDGIQSFGGEWRVVAVPVDAQEDEQVAEAADLAAAETMYAENCAQCHGRTGRGMASFPRIAAEDAAHIATRLMQYRAGETVGPNSALMWPVAAPLTDQEIADIAAFVATTFQ